MLAKEELGFLTDPQSKEFSKQFASFSMMEGQGGSDVSSTDAHKADSLDGESREKSDSPSQATGNRQH